MKILLINPWITDFAAYDFWIKPLGLLYIGAFLKERGHEIRMVDCMDRFQACAGINLKRDSIKYNTGKFHREIITKPDILKQVKRHYYRYGIPVDSFQNLVKTGQKPDVILITSGMTYWYVGIREVVLQLRKIFPGIPVALGGIYATLCEDHARKYCDADVVITGSSPSKIVDIVEFFGEGKSDGTILPDTFDAWPEPLWDLYGTLKTSMVLTTRGCPLNCTVCASKILFDGYERRDPVDAARSIINLADRGVKDIAFCDDALLIDTERHAVPMFEILASANASVRLHTPNGLHVREVTPDVARLMKQAGFVTIRLSLETVLKERMSDFSHKVSREEFKSSVDALYSAGFTADDLGAYILVGLPGQTMEEVLGSIKFVFDTGVKVRPALFSPVPGTVEFKRAVQTGMIRDDDDPLLHNNTLRTIDFFGGDEGYKEFRRKVDMGNENIGKGITLT